MHIGYPIESDYFWKYFYLFIILAPFVSTCLKFSIKRINVNVLIYLPLFYYVDFNTYPFFVKQLKYFVKWSYRIWNSLVTYPFILSDVCLQLI